MNIDVITRQDLHEFRLSLVEEIRNILQPETKISKKWLRSIEVRQMLNISPGTLQNLRINGTLPYTKVGSIMYYALKDIEKILEKGRKNG